MRGATKSFAVATCLVAATLIAGLVAPSNAASAGPSAFVSLNPTRILDTRSGLGGIAGPIPSGRTVVMQVAGVGGVPASGAVAVALNVTATNATAWGYVTAWPAGAPQPVVSNLNVERAGQTIPNFAVVRLGSGGRVNLYVSRQLNLVVDVAGYWTEASTSRSGRYVAAGPARVLDTRNGTGAPAAPIPDEGTIAVQLAGRGGIPPTGVSAVVLNVTATETTRPGYVTVWPSGQGRPLASNLNVDRAGQTIPNLAIVRIGADGKVAFYASRSLHLVADVFGYFTDAKAVASDQGLFVPLDPNRILDTRAMSPRGGLSAGGVGGGRRADLQVAGRGGVRLSGAAAVIANVTATNPAAPGFVTVSPAATGQPPTSNLNVDHGGQTIANLVVSPLGDHGRVSLFSTTDIDLLFDVAGWFTGEPPPSTPAPQCTSATAVPIGVSDVAQAVVDAQPAGTTYVVKAGTHLGNFSVLPKSGDTFCGEPGAVLDGGRSLKSAFSGGATNVTLDSLTAQEYASDRQGAAIQPESHARDWVVRNVSALHNGWAGLLVADGMHIFGGHYNDNDQLGIGGNSATGIVLDGLDADPATFDGPELARNHTLHASCEFEAGGMKWDVGQVTIRNAHVHDNDCKGLWADINVHDALIERNLIEDNFAEGIFYEISRDGVIRDNLVFGNGRRAAGWYWDGGITVASSSDVEIYGNRLSGNFNGITGTQQDRPDSTPPAHLLDGLHVHDNLICDTAGGEHPTGVGADNGANLAERDITFTGNTVQSAPCR